MVAIIIIIKEDSNSDEVSMSTLIVVSLVTLKDILMGNLGVKCLQEYLSQDLSLLEVYFRDYSTCSLVVTFEINISLLLNCFKINDNN